MNKKNRNNNMSNNKQMTTNIDLQMNNSNNINKQVLTDEQIQFISEYIIKKQQQNGLKKNLKEVKNDIDNQNKKFASCCDVLFCCPKFCFFTVQLFIKLIVSMFIVVLIIFLILFIKKLIF